MNGLFNNLIPALTDNVIVRSLFPKPIDGKIELVTSDRTNTTVARPGIALRITEMPSAMIIGNDYGGGGLTYLADNGQPQFKVRFICDGVSGTQMINTDELKHLCKDMRWQIQTFGRVIDLPKISNDEKIGQHAVPIVADNLLVNDNREA